MWDYSNTWRFLICQTWSLTFERYILFWGTTVEPFWAKHMKYIFRFLNIIFVLLVIQGIISLSSAN